MSSLLNKVRDNNLTVLGIVGFALFMDYFIYGLVVPLAQYSTSGNAIESQLGILYGAYGVGVLIATPLFGYLGDRIGCRKPMICGVALSFIATVLFCFGTNFYLEMLGRLAQGAAAAATWTAGLALLAAHYPHNRVQMMGLALVASTVGSVVGPVAGGWLYEIGGYTFPFIVTGALVALDACIRILLLPQDSARRTSGVDLKPLLLDKSVLVAALAVAMAAVGWSIIDPLFSPDLTRRLHATPGNIGLIYAVATIVYGLSAKLVAWACDRFSIRNAICLGLVSMAAILPLLGMGSSLVATAFFFCLVNVAYAFLLNPTSAELANAVDRHGLTCYSAVYAIYNIAYSLGMIASDSLASAMAASIGFEQTLFCVSGLMLLFVPLILRSLSPQIADELAPSTVPSAEVGIADSLVNPQDRSNGGKT